MNKKNSIIFAIYLILMSNIVLATPEIISINSTDAYSGTPGQVNAVITNNDEATALEIYMICSDVEVLDSTFVDNFQTGEKKIISFEYDGNVKERTQSTCTIKITNKANFETVEKTTNVYINPTKICIPNQQYCDGQKRMICQSDGSKFIELTEDKSCIQTASEKTSVNYYPYLIGIIIILIIIILIMKNKE